MAAVDLAVFVVDASSGLDHATVDLWRQASVRPESVRAWYL